MHMYLQFDEELSEWFDSDEEGRYRHGRRVVSAIMIGLLCLPWRGGGGGGGKGERGGVQYTCHHTTAVYGATHPSGP